MFPLKLQASELGKAFALISSAEPVSSLIGSVIFNSIYRATFDRIFPGFVFTLEVAFLTGLFLALLALWYDFNQTMDPSAQFGSLPEETQLRLPAVGAKLVATAAVSGEDLKAASHSGQTLTEVMNAWPQQYYGAADELDTTRHRGQHVPGEGLHHMGSNGMLHSDGVPNGHRP